MLNEITKGMDNAAEKINENFEMLIGDKGVDFMRFSNGKVVATQETSVNRGANIDVTIDFSIDFDEIDAIIFTATTRGYEDARDVNRLIGLRAYGRENRIRIMGATSNISWSGTGTLNFKITVMGTASDDEK